MRHAFIVEQNNLTEDFEECIGLLSKAVLEEKDEAEIIIEMTEGKFEFLVKGCFSFNPVTEKYEPQFWYNQKLINYYKIPILSYPIIYGKSGNESSF